MILAVIGVLGALLAGQLGSLVVQNQPIDFAQLDKLYRDGNYKEAYEQGRPLFLKADTDANEIRSHLYQMISSLQQLARVDEQADFLEEVVAAHPEKWQVLAGVASQYQGIQHYGQMIDNKFVRGGRRNRGQWTNSVERDRVRAMQLYEQALPLVAKENQKGAVASFYQELAQFVLNGRGYGQAWRLQYLTETDKLPDYEEGYGHGGSTQGAPVDENGKPIYYSEPKSWKEAANDGERWRWALAMMVENQPAMKGAALRQRADFAMQQFGVQTMQQFGFFPRGGQQDDKPETGTYALHTLKENETIARLANGVRRFEIPDEFNHIALYKQILELKNDGYVESTYMQLAGIFENRRQYPRAAQLWRDAIAKFGPGANNFRKDRLNQIVGNWGQFQGGEIAAAGQGAQLQYLFRNGKKVSLTASPIDVEKLLTDVKNYLKSNPDRVDYQQVNIQDLGSRIIHQGGGKYVGKPVAQWSVDLAPRENHFDKRVTIAAPLQNAGAYLVKAKMEGGNEVDIVVWIADSAIVSKQLDQAKLYYVADAVTGKALSGVNVEFFGFRQDNIRGTNKFKVTTKNFAEKTDADGQIKIDKSKIDDRMQWIIMARPQGHGLAYMGFDGIWFGQRHDPEYNETKAFLITDRPVYRPDQTANFKFWIGHAQYDKEGPNPFANRQFRVQINDPQGEKVYEKHLTTDEFGGMVGEWPIPADAKLGSYSIYTDHGGGSFRVEEYKKPEYEVKVDAPTEPVMLGEKIEATITAKYFFGAPVTNATVKYKIMRSDYRQDWYPIAPWDWFYGKGYWWFAYDYNWYPGYRSWVGCTRPYPFWFPFPQNPPELVSEQEVEIGADGTVKVEIDTELAKAIHADKDHKYSITAEVRDESRRTIVGSGDVLVAREPFKVFTWLDRGYYQVGDTIQANIKAQTLDGKPVSGPAELVLYKITYDKDRQPVETKVQTWKQEVGPEGLTHLQMEATAAGQYRLSAKVTDSKGHEIEGAFIFTIIGAGFTGSDYRFNHLELIPDKKEYAPGDTVKLQINTDRPGTTVLLFLRPTNGVYLPPQRLELAGKSTVVDVAVVKKDMPNFFVEAVTVYDGAVYQETKEIVVPPEKRIINVAVDPSSKEYKPGEEATVKIKLTDATGEPFFGSTVVSIYDKAVEYISGGSNVGDIREFFWKWRRHHHPSTGDSLSKASYNLNPPGKPGMSFLGVFGQGVADELAKEKEMSDRGGVAQNAMMEGMAAPMSAAPGMMMARGAMAKSESATMAMDAVSGFAAAAPGGGEAQQQAAQTVEPTVRTNFADTALWVGALTTNKQGEAEVSLKMPENLTTWKVKTWAMGDGTRVGSGEAEVITTKNLLIRLQAPRFFVQTDEVVLSANVHNYLKTAKAVQVSLETPGGLLEHLDPSEQAVKIEAGGELRVDWRVKVLSEGTAVIRMKALTDEESDAMEMSFPVKVHGLLKTESWAGTVQPEVDTASLTVTVPQQRRIDDSRLVVRYTPTLAGAMVDALPYMVDYPYGCTEQTLNRFLPTVITQKVLLDMQLDLKAIQEKRNNLNAQELGDPAERAKQWKRFERNPVFEIETVRKMVADGVQRLTDMQNADGGWGWFSGYYERSYAHTTAVVVHGLQVAQENDVAIVPGVINGGLDWLSSYQAAEVQKLQNADGQKHPWKTTADNVDAFVYMILVDAGRENRAMRDFLYRDRTHLSVYAKAMYALGLHKMQDADKLAMLQRNIEQYLVTDLENETAYLKMPEDNYWWNWYGDPIEANAYYLKLLTKVDPQSKTSPRLVKYLLNNRKHATYWASTRDTSLCIEAMSDYLRATGEMKPDMTVEIWIDGEKKGATEFTKENLFTVDNTFELIGKNVTGGDHKIEIRRQGEGAVYFNAYLTNFTLEDFITKAGLEVKVERRFYKLVPEEKEIKVAGDRGQAVNQRVEKYRREPLEVGAQLVSGDLVEIELVLESKNDYEYVMFEDQKAAGFEAVDLRSGYDGNSLGAYKELRDDRVTFFVRQLPRGKHSLTYKLRAEIPGKFSALPAIAQAMYAPELVGNSDEMKISIIDQE
ncbi:alpha-2-macroglobulin [Blastopirellula sp. JC732]|uniref:Alpha-2-macroglobulin n=1 Tax=Blastopirellula sediminis TaxID=2894196 RepID=A0A9X1SIF4_9BACT|nr:MG2 domain-containing protein [Blastopirellula sediminis]MCC9609219.1 alpha-2-macroglobulin [Blastopirellula sediminis]MCC9628004.1 alpha-2-macroglobulin [Blastopirellula sediminis]